MNQEPRLESLRATLADEKFEKAGTFKALARLNNLIEGKQKPSPSSEALDIALEQQERIQQALILAVEAHAKQKDRPDAPMLIML
ncbi:MAG: hypothetical protein AAB400_03960 [Patescibacteria group bacterium]